VVAFHWLGLGLLKQKNLVGNRLVSLKFDEKKIDLFPFSDDDDPLNLLSQARLTDRNNNDAP
jgi:hypothetical protein